MKDDHSLTHKSLPEDLPSPSVKMGRGQGWGRATIARVVGYVTGSTPNPPAPKGTCRNATIERCPHTSPAGT